MLDTFPDRRDLLFGREADIRYLTERAQRMGLTAVVARPLMGKTWTLTEVARRLLDDGGYLVGYQESKAAETSQFLYGVSNLYSRWLADSSMREQALSIWERYKDSLVPRIGKMVGTLFGTLGKAIAPEGVPDLVKAAFDTLAEEQKSLLTGDVQIAPLPYDQALSLTNLVAKVSERRIVLILDAWEKSPGLRFEGDTLEAFLKHPEDWPPTHVFLAIRNPDLDAAKISDEAYQRARNLCKMYPAAKEYPLPPMNQEDAGERGRLVEFVRERVPAARDQQEAGILGLVDGYPGVLDFWTNEANCSAMQTVEDLSKEADNAQALRYLELDGLLNGLTDAQGAVAARLAFFPRLDAQSWSIFRDVLLKDQSETVVDALNDDKVLSGENFPTYGHDTRHAAARHWFAEHRPAFFRRIAEQSVETLSARITGTNSASRPFFEALIAFSDTARAVGIDAVAGALLDAAQAAFGNLEAVSQPQFDQLYRDAVKRNVSVAPIIAGALIARAFARGQRGDTLGAITDCTAVIDLPNVTVEMKTAARYNRGVARELRGESEKAAAEFTAVIESPDAPAELVAAALYNRALFNARNGKLDESIDDYTAAIDLPNAPVDYVARALVDRGIRRAERGDAQGEIDDYTTVIGLHGAPVEQVAGALLNRGIAKDRREDPEGAIVDYTAVIELPNVSNRHIAMALFDRGAVKGKTGDRKGAIADYTTLIALTGVTAPWVAMALFNRGVAKGQNADHEGEMKDYTAVIALPGAQAGEVARALFNRGVRKEERGDGREAVADYTAAIEWPDAPPDIVKAARSRRDAHVPFASQESKT